MVNENIQIVQQKDPEIARVLDLELRRQQNNLELIASENIVSPEVMATMGSVLTNKYAEGYPGHRYYGGCEYVDIAELICIQRAKEIFGSKFANVQAHSGSQANFCIYLALCKPGDTVLGMDLSMGGHLTHGSKASFSGKMYNSVFYGVDPATGYIDYDDVRRRAEECRPRMIIAGMLLIAVPMASAVTLNNTHEQHQRIGENTEIQLRAGKHEKQDHERGGPLVGAFHNLVGQSAKITADRDKTSARLLSYLVIVA